MEWVNTYAVRLLFRFNCSGLGEGVTQFLDDVVLRLEANAEQMVECMGVTDNIGGEVGKLRISLARAQSVADYLIAQGIDKARIVVKGKGQLLPISSNDTAQGRALNRRVEIKVLEKK